MYALTAIVKDKHRSFPHNAPQFTPLSWIFLTGLSQARQLCRGACVVRLCAENNPGRSAIIKGGDHVILLGEVEEYEWHQGKPLVFHSGRYHLATRHPDLPE